MPESGPGAKLRRWLAPIAAATLAFPALACDYPDEGGMPLRRAVSKVRYLPEVEAWASAVHKTGAVVHYALYLEQTVQAAGRCHWTVKVRASGKTWRRFFVSPDGTSVRAEDPTS